MIGNIATLAEDQFGGLGIYRAQIERDVIAGRFGREEADEILRNMEMQRGYAALSVVLMAGSWAFSCLSPTLPKTTDELVRLALANATIEAWPYIDPRVSAQLLRLPGFILVRCLPGFCLCVGNLAILRADPRLHDVALRFCEGFIAKWPILRLLRWPWIHLYVRPMMGLFRWLYLLEWPRAWT